MASTSVSGSGPEVKQPETSGNDGGRQTRMWCAELRSISHQSVRYSARGWSENSTLMTSDSATSSFHRQRTNAQVSRHRNLDSLIITGTPVDSWTP